MRFARRIAEGSPWQLAAYDELFVNLNESAGGPARGLDQNRLFVGLGRVMGPVTVEAGYLLDTVVRPEPKPLLQRSCIVLWAALSFP